MRGWKEKNKTWNSADNEMRKNEFLSHYSYSRIFIVPPGKTCFVFTEAVVRGCSVKKGVTPVTLIKKRFWHRCFPVNFYEIFKNTCFYRTPPVADSVFKSICCEVIWKTTITQIFRTKSGTYIKIPIFIGTKQIQFTLCLLKYLLLFSDLNQKNNNLPK